MRKCIDIINGILCEGKFPHSVRYIGKDIEIKILPECRNRARRNGTELAIAEKDFSSVHKGSLMAISSLLDFDLNCLFFVFLLAEKWELILPMNGLLYALASNIEWGKAL